MTRCLYSRDLHGSCFQEDAGNLWIGWLSLSSNQGILLQKEGCRGSGSQQSPAVPLSPALSPFIASYLGSNTAWSPKLRGRKCSFCKSLLRNLVQNGLLLILKSSTEAWKRKTYIIQNVLGEKIILKSPWHGTLKFKRQDFTCHYPVYVRWRFSLPSGY